MTDLNKKAIEGLLQFLVALIALIFLTAWTLNYWQGWAFLGVFFASTLAITLYLMKKDPGLLARRMNAGPGAEKEKSQKLIQSVASIAFMAIFVLSSLDHRFAWSRVPPPLSIAGDILVPLGLYIVFLVFKENSFASGTIEVDPEQRIISTGPYAVVRHPRYSGAFIMLIGVPLALGSLWGLLAVIPLILAIGWRLLDEERFLIANLAGYPDYRKTVRYRLVPYIW